MCQELLPAEKQEQTVSKLRRKQEKDWPKVRVSSLSMLPQFVTSKHCMTTGADVWFVPF